MFTYFGVLAVVFAIGFLALWYLGRITERGGHHLYWGMLLQLAPWWWLRVAGALLVLDDAVQHTWQAIRQLRGLPTGPDWSLVHRAYVSAVRWICKHA